MFVFLHFVWMWCVHACMYFVWTNLVDLTYEKSLQYEISRRAFKQDRVLVSLVWPCAVDRTLKPSYYLTVPTEMTATLRRIDQTTLIVAPIATGQVMTYAGLENGALVIGAWNLCSVAVEYYLMWKVYTTVPALAHKQSSIIADGEVDFLPFSYVLCYILFI